MAQVITTEEALKTVQMWNKEGTPKSQIAKELKVSEQTIHRWFNGATISYANRKKISLYKADVERANAPLLQ